MKHGSCYDSHIEENVGEELKRIFGTAVEIHPKISECIFNLGGKHAVDFLLKRHNLYIEVKGYMTLYAINKMKYLERLLNGSGRWYYIFQATEESWMHPFDDVFISKEQRNEYCRKNVSAQCEELKKLETGEVSVEELAQRSKARLENYIWHRGGDLSRWREMHQQRFGKELWGLTECVFA